MQTEWKDNGLTTPIIQNFSRGVLDIKLKKKKKNHAFDMFRAQTPQNESLAVIYGNPPANLPVKKTKRPSSTSLYAVDPPVTQ